MIDELMAQAWDKCERAMDTYYAEKERSRVADGLAGEGWNVKRPTNPYRRAPGTSTSQPRNLPG